jgi:predicted DNA-binding transcriptional regulator AlpA
VSQVAASLSGQGVRQSPAIRALSGAAGPASTGTSADTAPRRVLNEAQLADFLGVSSRKLLELRHEPWFPPPLVLGPRATRWLLDEVLDALKHAPRGGVQAPPKQFCDVKKQRSVNAQRVD